MLTLIYGNPGSGKTNKIYSMIRDDAEHGKHSFLIVPEQITLDTERRCAAELPASTELTNEILSFSRLANRVFREYGGLCYNYASEAVRRIVMQRSLKECAPMLSEYRNAASSDRFFPASMLNIISEFKRNGFDGEITDDTLKLLKGTSVGKKLNDILTVSGVYGELLSQNFSDPDDDISKLYFQLKEHQFFKGANVYLDSFQSLTGMEFAVLREIMQQADNLTITFSLPTPTGKSIDSLSQRKMSDTIRKEATLLSIIPKIEILQNVYRYKSEAIKLLSSSLWLLSENISPVNNDNSIRLIRSADEYAESEEIAACIRELMENGYRCREIAVISRDGNKYRGIIEPELERAGIPYYFSEKRPLSYTAPARLLLSALKLLISGWRREDLISYLRTGLCDITRRETDIFENYCDRWSISGKGFFPDGDWEMNPDGFVSELSERGAEILSVVNNVRKRIVPVLSDLQYVLKNAKTARQMCVAINDFIDKLNVRQKLTELAKEEMSLGNTREASETLRVCDGMCDVLDAVWNGYSDDNAPTLTDFRSALLSAFDTMSIGSLPDSPDSVLVASADMVRAEGIRCVILPGVFDGSFPASVSSSGILTDRDREKLHECGIPVLSNTREAAADELFYIRRAISFASEKVIIFTRGKDRPSVVCDRINSLVRGINSDDTGSSVIRKINTMANAREYLRSLHGTQEGESLKKALKECGFEEIDETLISLDASKDFIDSDVSGDYYGNKISLSQSKIEKYLSCPFAYTCKYILNLGETGKVSFNAANVGTFIHFVLEHFLYEVYKNRNGVYPVGDSKKALVYTLVNEYADMIAPEGSPQRTGRFKYRISRLCRLALAVTDDLLNEFSDSSFIPEYFEVKIGSGGFPPLSMHTKDGTSVMLNGIVDRVDVFRSGGATYVRVVDYKTGNRTFSLEDIDKGENLQLLLYLFSLTQSSSPLRSDGTPVEAGITFLSMAVQNPDLSLTANDDEVIKAVADSMNRQGLVLNNDTVISAESNSNNAHFLPQNKDALIDSEKFGELKYTLEKIITEIAGCMKEGNAAAVPGSTDDSCRYCAYSEACRNSNKKKR